MSICVGADAGTWLVKGLGVGDDVTDSLQPANPNIPSAPTASVTYNLKARPYCCLTITSIKGILHSKYNERKLINFAKAAKHKESRAQVPAPITAECPLS